MSELETIINAAKALDFRAADLKVLLDRRDTQLRELEAVLADRDATIADLRRQLATPTPTPTPPAPIPVPVRHRNGISAWFSDRVATFAPGLRELLIDTFRGWITVGPQLEAVKASDFANARNWKQAGFWTIGCIAPHADLWGLMRSLGVVAAERHVRELAKRVAGTMGDSLDVAEIGNEPDLNKFWLGKTRHFIEAVCAPFMDELRKANPAVKIASPSLGNQGGLIASLPEYAQLVAPLKPDYIAGHLYADRVSEIRERALAYRQHTGQIAPLLITEWDCQRSAARWADSIADATAVVQELSVAACYYRLYDRDEKLADWDDVSPFTKAGAKTPYFAHLRAALARRAA